MKNNKGITLVSLVITIIVLMILATISVDTGLNAINNAKYEKGIAQMEIMQTKVNDLYEELNNGNILLSDIGIQPAQTEYGKIKLIYEETTGKTLTDEEMQKFRYVTKEYIETKFDLEGLESDFIINIPDRIVIMKNGIKKDDEMYYSLNQIEGEQYNVQYVKPIIVSFDANGGQVNTKQKKVYLSENYGDLPTPIREGYTFMGWNGKNLLNFENVSNIIRTTINYNKVIFDSYSENGNISNCIQLQKLKDYQTYLGDINSNYATSGKKSFSFTKDSSFNILRFKLNGTKYDASFMFQPMLEDGKTYNFSYNIESANYQSCKATIGNIQLEEGSEATEYEPYYITRDTKVVQAQDHTLTAIWEAN